MLRAPALSSATDLRIKLHWLPVDKRIIYKLSCLTFKAKKGIPNYLGRNIQDYVPCRDLRSAQTGQLRELKFSSVFSSKSFEIAAPLLWNSLELSDDIRQAESYSSFKLKLKTRLFKAAYGIEP